MMDPDMSDLSPEEPSLTPFSVLLDLLEGEGENFSVDLPSDWLQGRTAYGGLTAALCVEAARRQLPDLPPLRSAQFALIGPASGRLLIKTTLLRRGKSSQFVRVEMAGDSGPAAQALLSFGNARSSELSFSDLLVPAIEKPESLPAFFRKGSQAPGFAVHFDNRFAGGSLPMHPEHRPEILLWLRHRDESAWNSPTGLIALADALPPAAIVLFPRSGPFSTMTWTLDMLVDQPRSASGWWLLQTRASSASAGYSTQSMTLWNDAGEAVMVACQNVAVFV